MLHRSVLKNLLKGWSVGNGSGQSQLKSVSTADHIQLYGQVKILFLYSTDYLAYPDRKMGRQGSGPAQPALLSAVSVNYNLAWVSEWKIRTQKDGESVKFGGKCGINYFLCRKLW